MKYLLPSLIELLNAALKIIDDAGIELEAVDGYMEYAFLSHYESKQLSDNNLI